MQLPTDTYTYGVWCGYTAIGFLVLTIIAFIAGWGFRFRLVGVTSFMMVLTAGIFSLYLGFFTHVDIPGAARYALAYDNGANKAVVVVSPEIEVDAIEPTLRQAAADLNSYGRTGTNGNDTFTISLRTVLHPQEGVSEPLFLGEVRRSLLVRDDSNIETEVFQQNLAKLKQ
ncbi:Ycf51-like protein [Hyella patelloides LEGE 07179]|uniref:Ycf51-like protein n=1 Tax=Hyella patelloides LEGE 07179 TaxID=945734 RepID=A0A563VQJ1_9CYAN|nr:Ycf51 family protein [Hyella patelloides]VEP13670.1 Ycf51-like protein [Hyella patelloides LEGE 07179]